MRVTNAVPGCSTRHPGWAGVLHAALAQAVQTAVADDEATGVALLSAGEGDMAPGVVGAGVLHVLPDDVGAIGAEGAEGVVDRDASNLSGQVLRREQRAARAATAAGGGIVLTEAIRMHGAPGNPARAAADEVGLIAGLDHQDSAGGAAGPAHLAELVGVGLVAERRAGVSFVRRLLMLRSTNPLCQIGEPADYDEYCKRAASGQPYGRLVGEYHPDCVGSVDNCHGQQSPTNVPHF